MNLNTENILGYPVTAISLDACLDWLVHEIGTALKPIYLACLNPHSIQIAHKDPASEKAIKSATIIIPDGMGIVIASSILGGVIRERITGSDIFRELSHRLNEKSGYSYYFLGSTDKNLSAIEVKLDKEFPCIRFAGAYSPSFKDVFSDEENRIIIEAVNKAAPDVLWVGMTAPKQEKWIYENRDRLNVKFIAAVGAVFDFYVGNVKRSHPWFLKHGLEWLPRLLQEPRRLWRRTFISAPIFFWHVIMQRVWGNR